MPDDSPTYREARRTLGLTQQQLAQRLGVTRHSIANWERGRARPSREHRWQLAQALGLPFEEGQSLPWQPSEFAKELNSLSSLLGLEDKTLAEECLLPVETIRAIRDGRQPSLEELRAIVRTLSSRFDDTLLALVDAAGLPEEQVYGELEAA